MLLLPALAEFGQEPLLALGAPSPQGAVHVVG